MLAEREITVHALVKRFQDSEYIAKRAQQTSIGLMDYPQTRNYADFADEDYLHKTHYLPSRYLGLPQPLEVTLQPRGDSNSKNQKKTQTQRTFR